MELLILGGLFSLIFYYLKFRKNKIDLSILPEEFIVFDLETTGLNPNTHEIIEIGAVRINKNFDTHISFQALIKPNKNLPSKITEITGITQENLDSHGENIDKVLLEFVDFIGDLRLVAFNADFDMQFLRAAVKSNYVVINNPVSCALKMARRAWPGLKSYKLVDLAERGGLSFRGNHRAIKDCELTTTIYIAAAKKINSIK